MGRATHSDGEQCQSLVVRFEEAQERDRQRGAVEICIESLKRVDVSASDAVRMLIEAAEGNADVLLEMGGSAEADDDQPDELFVHDPLMTYVNQLVDAAVGRGEVPTIDPDDAALIERERRLLDAPLADAFAELSQLVPALSALEGELRATGALADPTERTGWRRTLYRLAARRHPTVSFFAALRARLGLLVGGQATPATDPLARTFIAYEMVWDHLRSVAGYPPKREWDEPRPPIPTPQEALEQIRQTHRERRRG